MTDIMIELGVTVWSVGMGVILTIGLLLVLAQCLEIFVEDYLL